MAQLIPGVKRVDAYTLEYKAKDPVEAMSIVEIVAWIGLAGHSILEQAK